MSSDGWRWEVPLGDAVEVNPKRELKRGVESAYVGMADLTEHQRRVTRTARREFKSGARFRNGDTLLARITPCLENGKTSFVDVLDFDEVAHGSTEFIVLTAKPGVSDPLFIYYLAISPDLRDYAVARMIGSSGRQRVAADQVAAFPMVLPPLKDQRAVAEVLGALDDRIEWCRRGQELLRSMLHARFQSEFRVGRPFKLGDITETVPGRSYKSADLDDDSLVGLVNLKNIPRHGGFNPIGVKGYSGAYRPRQIVRQGELVVACTDMTQQGDVIGRVGRVRPNPTYPTMVISMDMAAVRPVVPWLSTEFLAEVLSTREYVDHAKRYVNGTTVLHMKKTAVAEYETELPEPAAVAAFTEFARPMWERHDRLDDEAHALAQLRDTLLPRLLSGELRIENPERLLEGVA